MKKIFTLATLGLLSATAFEAQAQITVDGVVDAAEIGAANTGRYSLLGRFNTPHIENGGFGNWGLLSMYAANSSSKLYVFVAGTMQNSGNGFQLYMDLPNVSGVPAGTALPTITGTSTTAQTMFEVKGSDPGVAGTKMDQEVDMALALKGDAAAYIPQALVFTSATAGTTTTLAPNIPVTGAATAITAPTGAFTRFANARMAYRNSVSGSLVANFPATNPGAGNPGNTATNPGSAGSYGWEIELDRTALGLPSGASIIRLMSGYVANGGYWSSDVIPEITGNGNTNLENRPDFTTKAGTQSATVNVVVLSSRSAADAAVAMSVFPNPTAGSATVTYQVLSKNQPVTVTLTDLMGRTVRTLQDGIKPAGFHNATVSSQDVSAGTYMVKVQVGDLTSTRKVVLL
ncbi:T9SS type A sorting domain-containing protein [Hymenobacter lucidus]|uniref:T9SS type A sorting domain-containing protein n=1 Tax=Hymenobacter lucidus TaxID=2880930 RepID=A0ABS8ANP4_9BACT|nr:T9SS type A sorting domain-containing protein [Hymenobacter lucidus]MCB2407810.1 T9SS type A sorting domain-containing protein [Hymenobacter lucidus]